MIKTAFDSIFAAIVLICAGVDSIENIAIIHSKILTKIRFAEGIEERKKKIEIIVDENTYAVAGVYFLCATQKKGILFDKIRRHVSENK